jgi:PIN domain nuclease of toxin-antitoxin system
MPATGHGLRPVAGNRVRHAIKRATGKLDAPGDVREWIARVPFEELPITVEHGVAAGALPLHHRDPFDRVLVAQAQVEKLTLVAHDHAFDAYDVAILDASL